MNDSDARIEDIDSFEVAYLFFHRRDIANGERLVPRSQHAAYDAAGHLFVAIVPEIPPDVFVIADDVTDQGVAIGFHHNPQPNIDAQFVLIAVDLLHTITHWNMPRREQRKKLFECCGSLVLILWREFPELFLEMGGDGKARHA